MSHQMEILEAASGLQRAVALLRAGDCVALPTETVYGLAADAANDKAVSQIFKAKGRPADHPLIVHIARAAELSRWATDVPDLAYRLADQYWPGPLTLLLHKAPDVSSVVTGGRDTIALRTPEHPLFLRILEETGLGLAAPSANRYKKLSPTTAMQVATGMQGEIKAVLDGGPCEFGLESTILDLTSTTPTILRAGPITRASLEDFLEQSVEEPGSHTVAVPGNVAAHYQPGTSLRVVRDDTLAGADDPSVCYLFWSGSAAEQLDAAGVEGARMLKLPGEAGEYAKRLYSSLHQLDAGGFEEIRVEAPPTGEAWAAVNDRLRRAEGR